LSANGQAVPKQVLNETANNFMIENFPGGVRKIRSIVPFLYDNLNTLNLFELEPEGWILLSADMKVEPIIGFSFTGHFTKPDENINDPMYNWFNLYQRQIKQIVTDESLKGINAWKKTETKGAAASSIRVNPFMEANWDQGKNWNQFCPADAAGPGGHVYVGCIAVSMAQAMSVFKKPEKGQGYNNYSDPKYGSQYANFGNTFY
jgi:Peptidase C10 family.